MPSPNMKFYWVSYPNRFTKQERVHSAGCVFYGKSHGRGMLEDELTEEMVDCKACYGARRG